MIKTLFPLLKIQNTYRANGILYYLKKLPLVGRAIPYSLYKSPAWKIVIAILNTIFEIGKLFFGSVLYLFIIFSISSAFATFDFVSLPSKDVLLNLLLWATIGGGLVNCFILEPKKELNYAIMFMRMDAKNAALTSLAAFLVQVFISFLPMFIFFPPLRSLGLLNIISLFVILISGKLVGASIKLFIRSKRENYRLMKYSYAEMAVGLLLFLIGALFCLVGFSFSGIFIAIVAAAVFIASIFCLRYITNFKHYLSLYKYMFTSYDIVWQNSNNTKAISRDVAEKYIEAGGNVNFKKRGYALLSDLFVKRHRKLLWRTTRSFVFAELALVLIICLVCRFVPAVSSAINPYLFGLIPLFSYILYFTNCGERTVKIFFTNCDCEMLSFRFYRKPAAILDMFTQRLRTLVLMDWVQSLPIALGMPTILYASGGTQNPREYIILFFSIMALSTFFSVHNLVIYYLFQPFNRELELKNPIYTIIKTVTYLLCFLAMQTRPPALVFGVATSIFSLLYIVVSLPIAYKIAPNTFRLK